MEPTETTVDEAMLHVPEVQGAIIEKIDLIEIAKKILSDILEISEEEEALVGDSVVNTK